MARRRTKKRTHVGARKDPGHGPNKSSGGRTPKSMVLRIGAGGVGPSVGQLVKDVRAMMEPDTASRLKERRSNKLKDYLTMTGPLGVTHLLMFSRSSTGNTNLRIAVTPRGPTFQFRVEKYSLCKDVKRAMKHPKGPGKEYMTAPLLVMNNLMSRAEPGSDDGQTSVPKHLESLLSSAFQSLFPPIAPQTTPLSSIRRVLLVDRELHTTNPESGNGGYVVDLRHYAIGTKLTGLSKAVRRLKAAEQLVRAQERKKKRLPNLGRLDDLADYILDPSAATGYASTSESEVETDAEVEVLERPVRKVLSTKKHESQRARDDGESQSGRGAVEKRAVKLEELGPRMKLRLVKIEENVCSGKVLWHDFISKTKEEERKMETVWEERRREKEARIKQQRENIARKQKAQGQGEEAAEGVADDEVDGDAMAYEWDSEDVEEDGDMDVDEENAADSRK